MFLPLFIFSTLDYSSYPLVGFLAKWLEARVITQGCTFWGCTGYR